MFNLPALDFKPIKLGFLANFDVSAPVTFLTSDLLHN